MSSSLRLHIQLIDGETKDLYIWYLHNHFDWSMVNALPFQTRVYETKRYLKDVFDLVRDA